MTKRNLAAVIGMSVSRSKSPAIFKIISNHCRKPIQYSTIDIKPKRLRLEFKTIQATDAFQGLNVTIPHKEKIVNLLTGLSREAQSIGAVNVVQFKGRRATGHNTDVIGIKQALRAQGIRSLKGRDAVIFGAGGAAAAAAYTLAKLGARRITISNRTPSRAGALARRMRRIFRSTLFDLAVQGGYDLLINATPGAPDIPKSVSKNALAFDMLYRPAITSFMKKARSRRLRAINGLDMLIWQALGTWEIWNGPIRQKSKLKRKLDRELKRGVR